MYSVNSGNPLFFRASGSCSKIQNVKSIFHTAKNFWAALFIRASASCSNILNDKNTCSNTVKNIRANPFFRESASCSNILNDKKYIISTVNSGHPLFFRASACKLLKIPECNKYIQYSEKFQGNPIFQGNHKVAQKS